MRTSAKATLILVIALLALAIWIGAGMYARIPESPQEALKAFYEGENAEDQLMDPLILAGSDVVPLLEQQLVKPDMPRRRYAIGALGNIGSRSAFPVLNKLVRAEAEPDYIRCDALAAIAMIDQGEGLRAANESKGKGAECLAETSEHLQRDYSGWAKSNALRRTYFQALLGRHS